MGLFSDLVDIGRSAASIAGLFDDEEPARSPAQEAAIARANRLARLMDPTTQGHQNLVSDEEERLRSQFAGDIKDLIVADRRQRARGGALINPERRDETIAKLFTQQRETARNRARDNVRSYLGQAQAAAQGIPSLYQPMLNQQNYFQEKNTQNQASGYNALFDALGSGSVSRIGTSLLDGTPNRLSVIFGRDRSKPLSYDTPQATI